jgi:hypothetical protein
MTTGRELAETAEPCDGKRPVFVAIVLSDVLPVDWFAAVATPVVLVAIVLKEVLPVV